MWDDTFRDAALIVVDAQKGFSELCPNQLPVPGALDIVKTINRLLIMPWKLKYATLDWHPGMHSSFKHEGGAYPPHCVIGTPGGEFLPGLWADDFHGILRKGFRKERDAYSACLDHPGWAYGLLQAVKAVYVCGLCTNICVYETASDFVVAGHRDVSIIEDASAALDLPEDSPYHLASVRKRAEGMGIKFVKSADFMPLL